MTVGERIRSMRKELGIEVEALASAVGLRPSTLYDLENGRSRTTTKLHAIARELRTTPEFLETGRMRFIVQETGSFSATPSRPLRIDPDTIAAAVKLVRLAFLNLDLEFNNESDGVPLAFAYEYLLSRSEQAVTADNVVDFSKRLADRLKEQDSGGASSESRAARGSDRISR